MNPRDSRTKPKVEVSRQAVRGTAVATPSTLTLQTSSTPNDAPGSTDTANASSCCARFQFSEGFLLDTVTGELWQFNRTAGVLVAVPRVATSTAGQADNELINEQLQKALKARAQMQDAITTLIS